MATYATGFVYALTNRYMPSLVKIGMSEKQLAEDRSGQISAVTGVPAPYEVAHVQQTSRPRLVEQRAHELLANFRVNDRREHFQVSSAKAIESISRAVQEMDGIAGWQSTEPIVVESGDRLSLSLRRGQFLIVIPFNGGQDEVAPLDLWQGHRDGDVLDLMGTADPGHISGLSFGDQDSAVDPVPDLDRKGEQFNLAIIGKERLERGQRLLWLDDEVDSPACVLALFDCYSHCQVVCRTASPMMDSDGRAMLLNDIDREPSPLMVRVTRAVLRLPPPAVSTEPLADGGSINFGAASPPAEHWLPQLLPRTREQRRTRKTNPDGS